MFSLRRQVADYLQQRTLLHAGERVGVAVSGGADSVALLRILLELRQDFGSVLSVAHFHHGIRGAEADHDESFVAALAKEYDLQFHVGRGDAVDESHNRRISLETAARQLRQAFFLDLLNQKKVSVIATAHTLDDQAETALMKLLRGAGTRGLAGIFPEQGLAHGRIVRPLLEVRREQLHEYLRGMGQSWREDESNGDVSFTRNRLRALVMPLLREEINPSVDFALVHAAEIARAEEQYWQEQISRLLPLVLVAGEPARGGGRTNTSSTSVSLDIGKLQPHPLAVQRRLLRAAADHLGCELDFRHVQDIFDLLAARSHHGTRSRTVEIANGWRARLLFRELRLEREAGKRLLPAYERVLPVPGEVELPELGIAIRARISQDNGSASNATYNRAQAVRLAELSPSLLVRNWRAGDRFQPARHRSEKRLKELLYALHLPEEQKRVWPVVAAGEQIVWVRGLDSPELILAGSGRRLCIEESE